MDDAIREVHGMKCATDSSKHTTVVVREGDRSVVFDCTIFSGVSMTPWQARYLAAKLYRLSRRIRQRSEAVEATGESSLRREQ